MAKRNPSLPGADALFGTGGKKKPEPLKAPPAKNKAASPKKKTAKAPKTKRVGEKPTPISSEVVSSSHNGNDLQKYTFYIYPSIEEKLEEVWYRLRRKRKEKIPKWRIVNAILDAHLGDMEQIEKLLDRA